MGKLIGLKSINKFNEDQEQRREAANRPKAVWVALKDGQKIKLRFLQELDPDSPNYSEKNGLAFIAVEHSHPDDYTKKGECSADEESDGRCYGCEQNRLQPRTGWSRKTRLYSNVLVDNGIDDPFVAILSQGTSGKAITPTLIEYAGDTGSITNRWWKITRKGSGFNDTSYIPMALDVDNDVNVEDYELFDLSTYAVREVPYEDQAAFYNGVKENAAVKREEPADVSW